MKKCIAISYLFLTLVAFPVHAQSVEEQYRSILQNFVSILVMRINMLAEQLEKTNADSPLQVEIQVFHDVRGPQIQ